MFPLTDSSLLFVTLLIIAFIFLGIFILFGILILNKNSKYLFINKQDNDKTNIPVVPTGTNSGTPFLSVGDWVSFLTAEKHGLASTYFGFLSIVVALFGIIDIVNDPKEFASYVFLLLLLIIFVIYMVWWGPASRVNKKGKAAKEILDKIMCGTLKETDSIQKEWINEIGKISKKPNK